MAITKEDLQRGLWINLPLPNPLYIRIGRRDYELPTTPEKISLEQQLALAEAIESGDDFNIISAKLHHHKLGQLRRCKKTKGRLVIPDGGGYPIVNSEALETISLHAAKKAVEHLSHTTLGNTRLTIL